MSDSYFDDEIASEDETASSPISLSKSLLVTPPPYSPCTMSSYDGESDTAEVTDESPMGSENLQWSGYRIAFIPTTRQTEAVAALYAFICCEGKN